MRYIIILLLFFSIGLNAQKMDSLKKHLFNEYSDAVGETFRVHDKNKFLFKTKLVLSQINYYIYDTNGNPKYNSIIEDEGRINKEIDYYAYSLIFYHKKSKEIYMVKPLVNLHKYYIGNNNQIPKLEFIINEEDELELIKK